MPVNFPTLVDTPDVNKWSFTQEDPAIRTPIEGGYVVTRPRHTRKPRRTWSIGFTYITEADKELIRTCYESARGGSDYIVWTNPETLEVLNVRFTGEIRYAFSGKKGGNRRWDVSFSFEEV